MDRNSLLMQIAPLMIAVACLLALQIGGILTGLALVWWKGKHKPE